jgi:hypothetical protein
MTIPAASMPREGTIAPPPSATELMALAVTRPLLPEDLDPIAPVVLLRRLLGRRSVSGTLEIEQGGTLLEVGVEGGSAWLDLGEQNALMEALESGGGRWRLRDERDEPNSRELHPLPRLAIELLRKRLRGFTASELEAALAGRVDLAPAIRADRERVPQKLGIGPREQRFIEGELDRNRTARRLSEEGALGKSTCFQLLCFLELFECLSWQEPADSDEGPERDM